MRKTIVILLALATIGGAAWWFALRPDAPYALNRGEGTTTTKQLTQDEVQRFESALSSGDRKQQASVMTPELRTAYLAQDQTLLPRGGAIRLQPDTFTVNGNAATVDASFTAPGGASTDYTLVLVRTDTDSPWLLVNTEGK